MEAEKMKALSKHDLVRDCYGKVHEVMAQQGTHVMFYDGQAAHRTKVFRVYRITDSTGRRLIVSIPGAE